MYSKYIYCTLFHFMPSRKIIYYLKLFLAYYNVFYVHFIEPIVWTPNPFQIHFNEPIGWTPNPFQIHSIEPEV